MASTLTQNEVRRIFHTALLSIAGLCSVAFLACAQPGQKDSPSVAKKGRTITVQASIQSAETPTKKWKPQIQSRSESLIGIQFVDADHGWVGSSAGSLFHTSDGGLTWAKRAVNMTAGASLVSFHFGNSVAGWIVLQKYPSDSLDYKANEFWIMHTRDAGQTWNLQYSGSAGQVDRLRFLQNGEGWAIGRSFSERDTLQESPLVMHTGDQGEHWTNVSEGLSSAPRKDGLTDLYITKASEATVTTLRGKILRTQNAGQSWEEIAAVEDEPDQTYLGRLEQTQQGRLWLLGGADSLEGMWGLLAKRELDGSWTKYRIGSYVSDAVFLTEKEIVACGHVRATAGVAPNEGKEGTILRSSDGGNTWTIVYQSREVPSINAVAVLNGNTVWAVGEKGFILRLEFPTENGTGFQKEKN